MKMLKIDALLRYKQRSTCLNVLISTAIHAKLDFVTVAWSPHTFNPHSYTEIVWEERRLMEFLKLNGKLVAARYDSKKTIFLKGPQKQKESSVRCIGVMYFCISTWVSATMRLGFYMHWLICDLSQGASGNFTPVVNFWIGSLCLDWKWSSLVMWLEKSLDELSNCMTFYRIYEHREILIIFTHNAAPIHHCPVEKGFATSCFLWNIIWG